MIFDDLPIFVYLIAGRKGCSDEGAFCPFPEKEKTEKNFITNSPNPRATCVCVCVCVCVN
jgi:hypothetical protein